MSFFNRYKKIFLILGFIFLAFLFGFLLWKFFFQTTSVIPVPPSEEIGGTPGAFPTVGPGGEIGDEFTGPGQLPSTEGDYSPGTPVGEPDPAASAPSIIASGGLTETKPIVEDRIINPTISSSGSVNYYNTNDGYFYSIDENGNAVRLSDKVFHQVEAVTWAPDVDKAIIEYPDGSKIMYNFDTDKQVTLPNYWEDFSFASGGEEIVAKSIGLDPDNRWLIVSNSDGSQATALEPIGTRANYVFPDWSPNNQIVATYTRGVDFDRQEVFFVGLHGENFKSTIIEGRGLQSQWSANGDKLLYSVYHSRDEYIPKLWIVGASGDTIGANRSSLELNTWADKCTFASNSEVYCAVPERLEPGAGMFPELADRTKDNLYKIDLSTGAKNLIAVPNGAFNISQIVVPDNQKYLYFTDKSTGQLYQIRLK
ncbi:MAG: hypothetical protein ACOX0H_02870 [Patescibacteria group bacterium]|jgi:hypothetical protein|nr:hypothetical protein [bacterium]HQC50105.1 hypothetical protein [bacterium]